MLSKRNCLSGNISCQSLTAACRRYPCSLICALRFGDALECLPSGGHNCAGHNSAGCHRHTSADNDSWNG